MNNEFLKGYYAYWDGWNYTQFPNNEFAAGYFTAEDEVMNGEYKKTWIVAYSVSEE